MSHLRASPRPRLAFPTQDVGFGRARLRRQLSRGIWQRPDRGVIVHFSTMLDDRDVHLHRVPRRTRPARSVCDAATWGPSHRFARMIVLAAFQQGLVNLTSMRGLGLPKPTRQSVVRRGDGRYYVDVEWPDFGICVEIHGAHHREVVRWSADLTRANEVTISGRRGLAFTSFSVRHEREAVGDQLLRLFVARGWHPPR